MSKWFVAVTAGRWQVNGIQKAVDMGLKVVAIDADPTAEGFAYADHVINLPLTQINKIISELNAMKVQFCGVASFASDIGVPLAAIIREQFSLHGARTEVCSRLVNKARQRQIWASKSVPGPAFQVVETSQGAVSAIRNIGFPVVIKPTDSSGSRGVTVLHSLQDDIDGAVTRAFHFARTKHVLIESYMEGNEFTVESFFIRGEHHVLAVTEKKKVQGTRGVVAQELATQTRPYDVIKSISQVVGAAYRAVGYEDGPGHAEVILMADNSIGLVEIAGRGGGFLVFDRLVPTATGIDIARLTVEQAIGNEVSFGVTKSQAVVLRFIPARPGRLRYIRGINEANTLEGVEAGAIAEIGSTFGKALTDGDRLGWILSRGDTPDIAQQRADAAEALIKFDLL